VIEPGGVRDPVFERQYASLISRRDVLASCAALLVAPLVAGAQETARPRRVGYLSVSTQEGVRVLTDAFRERLRALGWREPSLVIEHRFADGNLERLPELAADLVRLRVDVIYAPGTPAALAVQKATQIIPVVMLTSDALATRLVGSLARPTGNMTGLTNSATELVGKQLELLRGLVPGLSRIAVLSNPAAAYSPWVQNVERATRTLGLRLELIGISGPHDIERGLAALARAHPRALLVGPDPFLIGQRTRIVQFVASEKIPTMYGFKEATDVGGLISYSASLIELTRRAAEYVDRILRGTKPADLPVEEPTKFGLVINLTTAKGLGLTIPPLLLLRADQLIE
jgi:putative ABC transport system substrate-binding protein